MCIRDSFHNDVTEQLHAAADPAHILIVIDGLKIPSDDGGMSPDTVSYTHLSFIAVFYTGLSLALLGTGLRFIWYWWRNR